jgi:C2H2-type zinc finger protein
MPHAFQHINASHPGFRCRTCNLPFASDALLDTHYKESPRHPTCPECQLSFEDNLALIQVLLFCTLSFDIILQLNLAACD